MCPNSQLVLENQRDSTQLPVDGQFDDMEWKALNDFILYAHDLAETSVIKSNKFHSQFKLVYNKSSGFSETVTMPDIDDIKLVMYKLRPFILERESTSFNRVCGIVYRNIRNETISRLLGVQQDLFQGKIMRQTYKIAIDDTVINSEDLFMKWVNGFEYHRDEDKRAQFEQYRHIFSEDKFRAIFVDFVIDKIRAIDNLCILLEGIVGRKIPIKIIL